MEVKRPRWSEEGFLGIQHASDNIVCKTCVFRPCEINGVNLDRADTGNCQIYEYPESKPHDVYFDGADCDFYEAAE
jgi:hypothetical protein